MHQHTRSVRGTRRAIRHSTTARTDPAAKAELAKQRQAILDLFVEGEVAHWKIGQRYNHIVQEKLAEKAGYTHARDFFAAEVKAIAQATLSGYGRVARSFTEEIAARYGMTKLNLLLILRKRTGAGPIEGDPGPIEVEVPGKNGSMVRKRFADVTVRELAHALRLLSGPPAEPHLPPLEKRIMAAMGQAIADHYGPKFKVGFKVRARNGKAYFTLQNVPLEVMDALFTSLYSAEWNERDRQEATPPPAPRPQPQPPAQAPASRAPRKLRSKRSEPARASGAKAESGQVAPFQVPATGASSRRSPWRPPAASSVPSDSVLIDQNGPKRLKRKAVPMEERGEGRVRDSGRRGSPPPAVRRAGAGRHRSPAP